MRHLALPPANHVLPPVSAAASCFTAAAVQSQRQGDCSEPIHSCHLSATPANRGQPRPSEGYKGPGVGAGGCVEGDGPLQEPPAPEGVWGRLFTAPGARGQAGPSGRIRAAAGIAHPGDFLGWALGAAGSLSTAEDLQELCWLRAPLGTPETTSPVSWPGAWGVPPEDDLGQSQALRAAGATGPAVERTVIVCLWAW